MLSYLATEEQSIFELFADSVLKDKLIYTKQNRLDYRKEEYQNKLLLEVFGEDQSDDPYKRTMDYIVTLEGLTRCDAHLANVTCGAVTYATGRKYVKDGDDWVPADAAEGEYFVAGNLLCGRWIEGGTENREWWEITIDGNTMNWTALREGGDGKNYTATFEMKRV